MFKLNDSLLNFSKIASTGFMIQIISFMFYPLIGRIYSPEEFGVFSFFSSLSLTVGIFITAQFHNASVNPKEDSEAIQLVSMSLWMILFFSFIFFVLAVYFVLGTQLSYEWLLFPFYLLALTTYEVLKLIPIRFKEIGQLNTSLIINRLGSNVLKIIRPMQWGSGWLIISEILCNSFGSFFILYKTKFRLLKLSQIDWKFLFSKYSKFPLFQTPSLFIQFIISEFPSYYFKMKGDTLSLGYYSMGNRLFVQPCLILGASLHPILIHKFKVIQRDHHLTLLKLFLLLGAISLLIFGVLYFSNNEIIGLIVGGEWRAGSAIYDVLIYLVLTKLFIGSILTYFISRDQSHYLFIVRGIELCLLMASINVLNNHFWESYIILEVVSDFSLILIVLNSAYKSRDTIKT